MEVNASAVSSLPEKSKEPEVVALRPLHNSENPSSPNEQSRTFSTSRGDAPFAALSHSR